VWCSRRTTSFDPRSGKRSGCSWNGRMARRQRRTLPRPRCRRTCHGASSFGESSSGGAPNGCTRTPRESLGWITTRAASFRGWNHHVSMVLVCFAFIVAERSRAFPPSAGKTATRKASHRHDGADGNPPGAALRDSFITVRLAVARVLATWFTPMPPVSRRDRWDRLVHMPVNTDGRLPFESVVLTGRSFWQRPPRRSPPPPRRIRFALDTIAAAA